MVKNPNGGISTVDSTSFNVGGKEVLIPQVVNNKVVSAHQALLSFLHTGRNLGSFSSPADANRYAVALHLAQALQYLGERR